MANPLTLAVDFQKNLDVLVAGANQDLLNIYSYAKRTGEWDEFAKIMRENYPKIYTQYYNASKTLSVGYYNLLRQNATESLTTKPVAYSAGRVAQTSIAKTQADSALKYGLSLAYRGFSDESVKQAFAGKNNAAVYNGVFDNMVANFDNDTFAAEYKRVPSLNACAFCLEVGAATGEDFEEGFDKKFHANCKCVVVVTFDNQRELDVRRSNLIEYEHHREEAKERIRNGEFSNIERVVPRNSEEYRNYVERELSKGSTEYRKLVEQENRLDRFERKELREDTAYEIQDIVPKLTSSEDLTQQEYDILDRWVDPKMFDEPFHKPITNVSHKDLLWVMRNEYGYR